MSLLLISKELLAFLNIGKQFVRLTEPLSACSQGRSFAKVADTIRDVLRVADIAAGNRS